MNKEPPRGQSVKMLALSCPYPPPSSCLPPMVSPCSDLDKNPCVIFHLKSTLEMLSSYLHTTPLFGKAVPQQGLSLVTWVRVCFKGGEKIRARFGASSKKSWLQSL